MKDFQETPVRYWILKYKLDSYEPNIHDSLTHLNVVSRNLCGTYWIIVKQI